MRKDRKFYQARRKDRSGKDTRKRNGHARHGADKILSAISGRIDERKHVYAKRELQKAVRRGRYPHGNGELSHKQRLCDLLFARVQSGAEAYG